jgi:hypothetical protein
VSAEFDLVAGNVVQLRDFKRREERDAADVRLATRAGMAELIADSADWLNTAPSEMPPVQPDFTAPSSDPA